MKAIAGRLWLDGAFRRGWVFYERGRIRRLGRGDLPRRHPAQTRKLRGGAVIPALVDTLAHGFAGVDAGTGSSADLNRMLQALGEEGVGTILAGLYPVPNVALRSAARAWSGVSRRATVGLAKPARSAGWHLEGPFLPPSMVGALPRSGLRTATARAATALLRACGGHLKMMTLAPEVPGALSVARALQKAGVTASIGHTQASLADCQRLAAVAPPAITHMGNRMPAWTAREPGPMGLALAGESPLVGVIADGVHVASENLRLMAATQPLAASLAFCSDCLAAAGTAKPRFVAAGKRLRRDGVVARDGKGGLGGVLESLPHILADRVAEGTLTWAQALRGGAEVPGGWLGDCGQIRLGYRADFAWLDKNGRISGLP